MLFGYKPVSGNLWYEEKFDQSFVSPDGNTEIYVRYDYISRPSVFLKNGESIFTYKGPGFMETIQFDVKWLDDDHFVLYNDQMDESFIIEVPK